MKSRLFFLPLLMFVLAVPLLSQEPAPVWPKANLNQSEQEFLKQAYDATALVYTQNDGGDLIMACTATAVLKNDKGYSFLTAGHCMANNDLVYYLSDDKQDPKTFFKVDKAACGIPAEGADFCLMHVTTDREFPVVAVGVSSESVAGEPAASISSPLGLGKQTFRGFVAAPHLKRPVTLRDKDGKVKDKADDKDKAAVVVGRWYDYTLFQMPGVNSASSGSALLCMNQRAICGVVVGILATEAGHEAVALPINIVVEKLEGSALVYRTAPKTKAYKK